jgi:hypothetical protein
VTDRSVWLIATREGALVLPDDTFAVIVPEVLGLRWRDMKMPRGMRPPAEILDRPVLPERPGWPLPVWREPTPVAAAIREDARRWVAASDDPEPWPGVRRATTREAEQFLAGTFRGGQPDPAAPRALAEQAVEQASGRGSVLGETREEAIASWLAHALRAHELHDFPPKVGGDFTAEIRKAFIAAADRVRPRSKRPRLEGGRPSLGDPTDRVAELELALRLERERRGDFLEFIRRLVLRAVTPRANARLLGRLMGLAEKSAWDRLALLVVAVEREPRLFGDPLAASRKAWNSQRVGLNTRARSKASE